MFSVSVSNTDIKTTPGHLHHPLPHLLHHLHHQQGALWLGYFLVFGAFQAAVSQTECQDKSNCSENTQVDENICLQGQVHHICQEALPPVCS